MRAVPDFYIADGGHVEPAGGTTAQAGKDGTLKILSLPRFGRNGK